MSEQTLSEEERGILRTIAERVALRQMVATNVLGHCLKFVPDVRRKARVTRELDDELRVVGEVREFYAELGWQDLESALRSKVRNVDYPRSWLEFELHRRLYRGAMSVAMHAYEKSRCKKLAAIARTWLESTRREDGDEDERALIEYCAEERNRPHAQEWFTRWVRVGLLSLGRPGSPGDRRAVQLGLRNRPVGELAREYLEGLAPFLAACGLRVPDANALDVELPAAVAFGT